MQQQWIKVRGILQKGHGVASGIAENNPYPRGTLEMQIPFFQKLGVDLNNFFPGTLNVSINPYTFTVQKPKYTFRQVQWIPEYPAEDFSFSRCRVIYQNTKYASWIYYPHRESKIGHFQDKSTLEIIAPKITGIHYGDRLDLEVNLQEISLAKEKRSQTNVVDL